MAWLSQQRPHTLHGQSVVVYSGLHFFKELDLSRRQYFAVLDTETTIADTVADIGLVIVDRTGKVYTKMAVLVAGHYDKTDLFYIPGTKEGWSIEYAQQKRANYDSMIKNGTRIMRGVDSINNWINKAVEVYNPTLTAYNLSFDINKCRNTGIDVSGFESRFCLWHAAAGNICDTREYRQFVVDNHLFNRPTNKGNMTYKTDAETVFGFLNGEMVKEPHTALEDALDFEVPILVHILKKSNWKTKVVPYNWNGFQVKNHFKAI